jgi:hypothetical protein
VLFYGISGHPDGILVPPKGGRPWLLEFKSMGWAQYKRLRGIGKDGKVRPNFKIQPKWEHVHQASFYACALFRLGLINQLPRILFIYTLRDWDYWDIQAVLKDKDSGKPAPLNLYGQLVELIPYEPAVPLIQTQVRMVQSVLAAYKPYGLLPPTPEHHEPFLPDEKVHLPILPRDKFGVCQTPFDDEAKYCAYAEECFRGSGK